MQRALGQQTGTCFQRCVGMDTLDASERPDWSADDAETILHWRERPTGQHIELGIAEVNLVSLLGEADIICVTSPTCCTWRARPAGPRSRRVVDPGPVVPTGRARPLVTILDGHPHTDWLKWFIHKDPAWDWHQETYPQYVKDFDQSVSEWADVLATNDPDLSAFKASGGKVIIWHGLHDSLIFPRGTIDYYQRMVTTLGGLSNTQRFARLFLAPNVGHCSGGTGPAPVDPMGAVVRWVENGDAPDTLQASLPPNTGVNKTTMTRPLCPFPQVSHYTGTGSTHDADNFTCARQRSH